MSDKFSKTFELLIDMLFKAKGLVPPKPEEYKDMPEGWYLEHSWTKEEEAKFYTGAAALLKKRHRLSAAAIQKELAWFNLMYGWRTEETQ